MIHPCFLLYNRPNRRFLTFVWLKCSQREKICVPSLRISVLYSAPQISLSIQCGHCGPVWDWIWAGGKVGGLDTVMGPRIVAMLLPSPPSQPWIITWGSMLSFIFIIHQFLFSFRKQHIDIETFLLKVKFFKPKKTYSMVFVYNHE